MSVVVALGEGHRLDGFALAGVRVIRVAVPDRIRDRWRDLDDEVGLVILTPAAAEAIGSERWERSDRLTVVAP